MIIDGKAYALKIKEQLKIDVADLRRVSQRPPCMVNVAIGGNHAIDAYVNSQRKAAEYIGIDYQMKELPGDISPDDLGRVLRQMSDDPTIDGIMIHKPVPAQIDYGRAGNQMSPEKDLDGSHAVNLGRILLGEKGIVPCTAAAAMELILSTGMPLRGKDAVVIGRSEIVGKPLALLLLQKSATVTICHSGTSEAGKLAAHISRADIVVAAIGRAEMIKGDWIKPGAVVIDVGINASASGGLVGDVEFKSAEQRAGFITPVPGGVGPVTAVILMRNCVEAFKRHIAK
ncbi:MAG: bifunctional 5,10-methylenetetrahydrofolate dehydrogenase/5,10-methenyltetrahydrofolate cyclohydrolase [Candidatus Omnitrophica bacterium]|nr:bifunctional 5,10-methylenetetrahydrofolate dehydrogenase/5,10-methenyltetrahydrofolate cyclohydrolase [Candidatus Omnitrophota bacterium]